MTAAVCSVILATVGGVLLATPANADMLGPTDACSTPRTLVDSSSTRSGAISSIGSATNDELGLGCVTSVTLGNSTPASSAPTAAPPVTPVHTTTPTNIATEANSSAINASGDSSTLTTVSTPPTPDPGMESGSTTSEGAPSATTTKLASLTVLRSSTTVYPVKDGYQNTVRFAIHGSNASGALIPVNGSAVLTKAGKTIKTWHVDGSSTVITWNGRIGTVIKPGLYTLTVSAWSPDGSTTTQRIHVRVLNKHLVKRTFIVRSNVGANSVSADLPRQLLKDYATGAITVRIHTIASVHRAAKLVFSSPGVSRSIDLRNGVHTTKALAVPRGFSHVTITHDWAKGDAHLNSLKAIWSYSTLS